jgi:hypothetical protein
MNIAPANRASAAHHTIEVEVDEGGTGEIQAHIGPEFRADRSRRGLTLEPVDTQVISQDAL